MYDWLIGSLVILTIIKSHNVLHFSGITVVLLIGHVSNEAQTVTSPILMLR